MYEPIDRRSSFTVDLMALLAALEDSGRTALEDPDVAAVIRVRDLATEINLIIFATGDHKPAERALARAVEIWHRFDGFTRGDGTVQVFFATNADKARPGYPDLGGPEAYEGYRETVESREAFLQAYGKSRRCPLTGRQVIITLDGEEVV